MQRPSFGPRYFILRPASVLFREGARHGIGIVPEVDARHIGRRSGISPLTAIETLCRCVIMTNLPQDIIKKITGVI